MSRNSPSTLDINVIALTTPLERRSDGGLLTGSTGDWGSIDVSVMVVRLA